LDDDPHFLSWQKTPSRIRSRSERLKSWLCFHRRVNLWIGSEKCHKRERYILRRSAIVKKTNNVLSNSNAKKYASLSFIRNARSRAGRSAWSMMVIEWSEVGLWCRFFLESYGEHIKRLADIQQIFPSTLMKKYIFAGICGCCPSWL